VFYRFAMKNPAPIIETSSDPEALAQRVAAWLLARALASNGRFTLALAGGSTPRRLYEILATAPYAAFPWARTHVFWGDERCVPQDDALSNFAMAHDALLAAVPIPPANIHPAYAGGPPDAAAAAYQATLRAYYGGAQLMADRPLFDVTLLGLGPDGHTASLFPGTAALQERAAWVTAVTDHVPQPRLTLTYPALAASAVAAFLVAGAAKAPPLRRVLAGDAALPASSVTAGQVIWFTDAAAMGAEP
jgi:6-phosphogluconolactonase